MTETAVAKHEIATWDEQTIQELDDGAKLTQARVTTTVTGDLEGDATWLSLHYYRPDGTASTAGFEVFAGRLGGRAGSFVLQSSGEYDGTRATGTASIVPGSATGELQTLRGISHSSSSHEDYPFAPFTLDYEFE